MVKIFNLSIIAGNTIDYWIIINDEFYRLVIELLLNFKEALTGCEKNSFADIL